MSESKKPTGSAGKGKGKGKTKTKAKAKAKTKQTKQEGQAKRKKQPAKSKAKAVEAQVAEVAKALEENKPVEAETVEARAVEAPAEKSSEARSPVEKEEAGAAEAPAAEAPKDKEPVKKASAEGEEKIAEAPAAAEKSEEAEAPETEAKGEEAAEAPKAEEAPAVEKEEAASPGPLPEEKVQAAEAPAAEAPKEKEPVEEASAEGEEKIAEAPAAAEKSEEEKAPGKPAKPAKRAKAKINLNRLEMPKQTPEVRRHNFDEVATGYTYEMAMEEASRCIQCKKRNCQQGCPVNIDIPDFIKHLQQGDVEGASRVLKLKTSLPGICGRVCPQELQCEKSCTLNKKGAPIAIGRLERYIADWERAEGASSMPDIAPSTGKKVAVVGTGPSGLTVAADLAVWGNQVTMYEALHVAGGVLMYGIPEFRLPKDIVQREVEYVKSLGVELHLDTVIGINYSLDELLNGPYHAVYLATGAGLPMFLRVPGENLNMIYSANEFLTRTNLMKAYLHPRYATPIKMGKRVAVIGGGNVAMDSARCAVRLGAPEVNVIYRRTRAEMPARLEEVENAEEEGIHFHFLCTPKAFISDGRSNVAAMELIRMGLGEPDASGRRRPVPIPGSEYTMEIDTVAVSLGTSPNPLIASSTPDLETSRWGTVVVDERGKTSKARVWAGGDIVSGGATVISAMGEGRLAAVAMHQFLTE